MAAHVLTNSALFVAGYDFTADTNEVTWSMEVDVQECTTFASAGSREYKPGLKSAAMAAKGFYQAGTGMVDPEVFPNLGTVDRVATWCQIGTAGTPAYFGKFGSFAYSIGGALGEMMPFTLDSKGTNGHGIVRGLLAKAKGNVSATGATGSALELGAVGATEYLYAAFHVFTAATTITVVVESDDNADFSSATTRGTIGPLSAAGGTWMTRVAGSITDTFYRLNVTAVTGTFSVAGAIGIGS